MLGFLSEFLSDIVDLKPENMEDLSEVITVAEFHPHHCHLLAFSSSTGTTRLCDMRAQALCDQHAKRKPCMQYNIPPSRTFSWMNILCLSCNNIPVNHNHYLPLNSECCSKTYKDVDPGTYPLKHPHYKPSQKSRFRLNKMSHKLSDLKPNLPLSIFNVRCLLVILFIF